MHFYVVRFGFERARILTSECERADFSRCAGKISVVVAFPVTETIEVFVESDERHDVDVRAVKLRSVGHGLGNTETVWQILGIFVYFGNEHIVSRSFRHENLYSLL